MIAVYSLNYSPQYVRHLLRQRFEANRDVTDLRAINVLLLKSRQEFQETMNGWKLPDQVLGILLKPKETGPPKTFLEKFYTGESDSEQRCILLRGCYR
jgi:NADH dehydrogenase (ubiquinone) 1 alpha subcomplex subunit 6